MAARANPLFDILPVPTPSAEAPAASNPLSRLAQIHAEAVETARLANLLGRSLHAAIALAVLAGLALALRGAGLSQTVAWTILMTVGLLAMVRAYAFAIRQPFERASLHAFAQDLYACLLYAGFAWGAGAFLALPAASSGSIALLFAAAPTIVLAALLRERRSVLLFLAPVAGLTSLACVLRPFTAGALAAAVALVAAAILAVATQFVARAGEKREGASLPHGLIAW